MLDAAGTESLSAIVSVCLSSLQRTQPLSRESALTSAVALLAAACLNRTADECALELARALFSGEFEGPPSSPLFGRHLAAELRTVCSFSRLSLLKALLAAPPPSALP